MEFGIFMTKVRVLARLTSSTLAIAVLPASLAGTALAVDVNQHGLTGSWYQPAMSGQGIELEVYQDAIAPGIGYLHGSWATFTAIGWEHSGPRWYTFGGTVRTGPASSLLEIFQNTGGNFNAPPETRSVPIGTMVLTFLDCTTAVMEYQVSFDWPAGSVYVGTIPLVRLTPNVTCSVGGASQPDVDFFYSGHWFDPATSGQGLFVELNRIAEVSFVVWYTYAMDGASQGVDGQRWYTGQGKFVPGALTLPMTLYETTGGILNSTDPGHATRTQVVGTATASFFDCHTAQWTFKFTDGSNAGASGTIDLSRVGPTSCDSDAGVAYWDY
jgi:hypothetical protein